MWLLAVVVGLAQATATPEAPARPPSQPPEAAAPAEPPKPVEEVVVTSPGEEEPGPPPYSVLTGPERARIEAEAARKAKMRRYRETGAAEDYPGIRCAIFHRC